MKYNFLVLSFIICCWGWLMMTRMMSTLLCSISKVIYFHCQGENKIILPDVKEKNFVYKFKGIESWQPIAGFPDKKCKRCGLYELDRLKSDDVFDEWELCPDEFLEGNYVHYKQKEFNATFACTECMTRVDKKSHLAVAVLLGALTSLMAASAAFGIYKYWQKRKREQNQARFLKLFDEGDDIDNELDL
ncbi:uncharacterized protein LOC110018644 isoform X2 [Phalaenopsis equestris]|uniref:uncharacterized protein LOC110018644 isoform X2 n=1 Tax=Phalaenopsis equestris TaxID=78828 RepID=UPI0009E6360C|nr:uncharacterized protein LOC110018644 isoform X2 [Phalaenopsis equestris]